MSLGYDGDENPRHTRLAVYTEMFFQISISYSCLPDPKLLTLDEIEWYYEGIRAQLEHDTKSQK